MTVNVSTVSRSKVGFRWGPCAWRAPLAKLRPACCCAASLVQQPEPVLHSRALQRPWQHPWSQVPAVHAHDVGRPWRAISRGMGCTMSRAAPACSGPLGRNVKIIGT